MIGNSTCTYIVLIPRGFEYAICEMLQQVEFQPISASSGDANDNTINISVSTKIVGEETLHLTKGDHLTSSAFVSNVRTKLQSHYHENKVKRRHATKNKKQQQNTNEKPTSTEEDGITTTTTSSSNNHNLTKINCVACSTLVGTIEYTSHQHVSIGYMTTVANVAALVSTSSSSAATTNTQAKRMVQDIWSVPGQMAGIILIEITICCNRCPHHHQETALMLASTRLSSCSHVIPNHIRFLGPIVALVAMYDYTKVHLSEEQSAEEAGNVIQSTIQNDTCYEQKFQNALQLWHQHVQECWPEVIDQHHVQYPNATKCAPARTCLDANMPLKYRVSCLRSDSKKYVYTRRELLRHIDDVIPHSSVYDAFSVDLTNYDLEIVLCYRPHCFFIGFAVRPYQYVGSGRSFASGDLPPDTAPPIVTSFSTLPRVVRLRPSTAQILLHLANLQPSDIVLDPCAGIGTIPIEARIRYGNRVFAIGGDLAMNDSPFQTVTVDYLQRASTAKQKLGIVENDAGSRTPVPDMLVWDATQLPIRSESIDVIVSDLPFGQLCMSAVKLDAFLPLAVAEMARVLRPSTGRMVLLCGSYIAVLRCLIYANECLISNPNELIWELPCMAVFPVNIGGNLAWVVQVRRTCGKPNKIPHQREKVRQQVQKREHAEKMMLGNKISKMKHPQS